MCSKKPEFSVRIVVCDHYLTKPTPGVDVIYSDFRGSDVKQVPVLRIFGPASDGHKTCVHVHGVFPYFYIPCPASNPQPQFLYQIAASLDKALNIAMKQATSSNQHVYKITLVKGLPFYGFHDKDHLYLKIFLYNPGLIKQAVELCSNGAILGQPFQPHESHLNFTLQFFIDFNLFGMSNIDLESVKFRKSGISQNSNDPIESSDELHLKPESICFYEVDCIASQIINRQRIGKGDGIENPGLEEVWNQEIERRKQLNISLGSKSLSQGRTKAEETESHYKFEQMFVMKMSNLVNEPVKSCNEIYYPAESIEGSQLFNAVDVSVHLPSTSFNLNRNTDDTIKESENTIVDETVAMNSSLSLNYSQVLLDADDLELVDMLEDMEEKPIDEDSILGTPAQPDNDSDDCSDSEYSQVFNDDTIVLSRSTGTDDASQDKHLWNDSFWNGANIPQLDGTCDEDQHITKIRKRKMKPFKLGLSRPRTKKKLIKDNNNSESKTDSSDEINVSRETIDSISDSHLKKAIKIEPTSIMINNNDKENKELFNKSLIKTESVSITDLVSKIIIDRDNAQLKASEIYDLGKQFEPQAGCSSVKHSESNKIDFSIVSASDSSDLSPQDDNLGIMSFYDASKIFDMSNENDHKEFIDSDEIIQENIKDTPLDFTECTKSIPNDTTHLRFTPKVKPPLKSYVESTCEKYDIPKVKHPDPYFSEHKDAGDKVEIGQTVLRVLSKSAKDQKPLDNVLDTTSIEEWRYLGFLQNNDVTEDTTKPDSLRSLLAGNRECILEPVKRAPTTKEVIKSLQIEREKELSEDKCNVNIRELSDIDDELDNSQALGLNEDKINNSFSLESDKKDDNLNKSLQVTMYSDGSFLCFGNSESIVDNSAQDIPLVEVDFLTVMLLEVHTSVRGDLHPDPLLDTIEAIFVTITNDCPSDGIKTKKSITEIVVVDNMPPPKLLDRCVFDANISYVNNEGEIFEKFISLIKKHDPDIMCAYDIEKNSFGYMLERSQVLGLELVTDMSRIAEKYRQKRWRSEDNELDGKIIGRITFNVWRLLRHELALSSYSFENCMYEILNERVPTYSYAQLWEWWRDESRILRWIPVEYYLTKLSGTVRMLEKLDIINRTSELARLFGLQWWEVLSRGSQFRVESLMLRAARPLNLVALSPTVKQRAAMRAPEFLPLIFEPESRFYTDPVIVLDFQSLYPSMMIAYNYCFSTCIGRVQNINSEDAYEFGAWRLRIPKAKLAALVSGGLVHWSPAGVGFVRPAVRRGVLPALLRRILAARLAVKKGMRQQTDPAVKRAMHSRQLGLKLIANVTYGYTAANFSGRMPCVEVGDSVVAKGRETLERAARLVRDSRRWNVKVVYGDTDSLFVRVPGGSRADAFAIGQQIADAVTADNPSPVALKLEKVYQPCILQTKKRYVGFMYESAEQAEPLYEAKGIETVRRDGCPAAVKLLRSSLVELFSSGDVSRVRRLAAGALARLAERAPPPPELAFTREYRGAARYRPGAAAPPNEIAKSDIEYSSEEHQAAVATPPVFEKKTTKRPLVASTSTVRSKKKTLAGRHGSDTRSAASTSTRRMRSADPRSVPPVGWRVRWVVCAGAPGEALVRCARSPRELLARPRPPHVTYYATRALLPPLHRCLSLIGVDVYKWWSDLGFSGGGGGGGGGGESTAAGGIARFMWRARCATCGARGARAVCGACAARPQRAAVLLAGRRASALRSLRDCRQICKSCCGHEQYLCCENTECPVLWRRISEEQNLNRIQDVIVHLPSQFTNENLQF